MGKRTCVDGDTGAFHHRERSELEGRREKRGGMKREGSVRKKEGEKRDWEGAREKEEQKMWSEQRIAVLLISPTHPMYCAEDCG